MVEQTEARIKIIATGNRIEVERMRYRAVIPVQSGHMLTYHGVTHNAMVVKNISETYIQTTIIFDTRTRG